MDEHVCLLVCYLSRWIGYLLCKLTGGLGVNIFFGGGGTWACLLGCCLGMFICKFID